MSSLNIDQNDSFVGTWRLQPELSEYEYGEPPVDSTYIIAAEVDALSFVIKTVDADGNESEERFTTLPDGVIRPLPEGTSNLGNRFALTRMDATTLDSSLLRNEELAQFVRRELTGDGNTMTVEETGSTPDGESYTNKLVYGRVAE